MTQRPGREHRGVQYRARRARHFSEGNVEQLLFVTLVTLLAAVALGHLLPFPILVTWLATFSLLAAIQAPLSRTVLTPDLDFKQIIGTTEVLLACTLIIGISWGLVSVYTIAKGDNDEQMVLVALLSSLVIYASTHVSANFPAFALYVLLLAGPTAGVLMYAEDLATRCLGGGVVVLIFAGLAAGWRHYQVLCGIVRAEVEVEEMNGVLKQLNARLASNEDRAN